MIQTEDDEIKINDYYFIHFILDAISTDATIFFFLKKYLAMRV